MARVNLLALVGAALGIFCMLIPWATGSLHYVSGTSDSIVKSIDLRPSPFFSIPSGPGAYVDGQVLPLHLAALMFLCGSLVAVLSPIGGLFQASGIAVFAWKLGVVVRLLLAPGPTLPGSHITPAWTDEFLLGFYLALLASVITLLSLVVSVSIYSTKGSRLNVSWRLSIRENLLTLRRAPSKAASEGME